MNSGGRFSRMQGDRSNRGRVALVVGTSATPPTTPLTILGTAAWWLRSDLLVTQSLGTASAWGDSSGNNVNFTSGAGQPTYNATGLDGRPTLAGNDVDKIMTASFSRVAPATQPFFMWFIARINTWTLNKHMWNDGGAALILSPSVTSLRAFNGTLGTNINLGGSTWFRIRAQFTAANTCIFRVGSSTNTSATGSAASGATTAIFSSGAAFSATEMAEAFCFLGTPSAQNLTDLDTYGASLYPSAVFG